MPRIDRSLPGDDAGGGPIPWSQVPVLEDFSFPWRSDPAPYTGFQAAWRDERLHFRFQVEDHDIVVSEDRETHEISTVFGSDRVEIFFSTGPELDPYYCFEIDPNGLVADYEGRHYRRMNWDWACDELVARGERTADGYRITGSLPIPLLEDLGCVHRDERGVRLTAGVYRAEFSHEPDGTVRADWISWVDPKTPEPDFHVPASFGEFRLLDMR